MPRDLSAELLTARAVEIGGLPVRGEAGFRPGLERFLSAFAAADTVTPAGRDRIEALVVDTLIARFRMDDWIHRHPEVLEMPVERPVFILGLPRAGTTLLLNLLAFDPQRRVYWNWEAGREIPPAHRDHLHDDPRIARRIAEVDALLASGMLDHRLHVEMGDEPTECTYLLGQDFKSNLWLSQTPVPDYFDWLIDEADMVAAYRYQKRALQVLQSAAPGKWTLKLPSHAPFVASLLEVFPDARIVLTHRDPVKPIPSAAAAVRIVMGMSCVGVDPAYLGREMLRMVEASVERTMAARDAHPEVPFYDFHYRRFAADPIAEIRRLYDFLGDDLSGDVENRMVAALRVHEARRDAVGPNVYRPEDFGLTRAAIDERFAPYMARFGIERE
jgi:hypothetical protein